MCCLSRDEVITGLEFVGGGVEGGVLLSYIATAFAEFNLTCRIDNRGLCFPTAFAGFSMSDNIPMDVQRTCTDKDYTLEIYTAGQDHNQSKKQVYLYIRDASLNQDGKPVSLEVHTLAGA